MIYDICVIGGCALDQTFFSDNEGNYPSKPQVVVPGGKASNQAVAASRAGAKVTIITRLGKDDIGEQILDNLANNRVRTDNVEMIEGLDNDVANIYVEKRKKDRKIQRIIGAIDSFSIDMIERNKKIILGSKVVVAQMKAPKEFSVALINFCYDNNVPIVITPCTPIKLSIDEPGNKELIDKISLITCNKEECEKMFETKDIESCIKQYPNKLIVTEGNNGIRYYDGKNIVHIDAPKIDNIEDTTGAGDTFCGNLVVNLVVYKNSLYDSIYKAQFAASMKLMKKTAQAGMPYKEELEQYIKEYNMK